MLIRLTAASGNPVPAEDIYAVLRVRSGDDDDRVAEVFAGAVARYEHFTGRIMAPASFECQFDSWCDPLRLRAWPVRSVTEVRYLDENHAEQVLPTDQWYVDRSDLGWSVRFTDAFSSPVLSDRGHPVRVEVEAGYNLPATADSGADADLASDPSDRSAILLMTQRVYDYDEVYSFEKMRHMFGHRRVMW